MAKKSVLARNLKRLEMQQKYAQKRQEYKKNGDYQALWSLPRNASPTRFVNRCARCGRGRGYLRDFGLCRICFRTAASSQQLPGVKKASW